MSVVCIPVPDLHVHKTVGLEVTVDGKKRVMNYRVESVPWDENARPTERIDELRDFLAEYDESWDLVQIGPPDGGMVPLTFRQHVLAPVD